MPNPLADELSARRAKPCVLVIFGATGDLTRRKLVPSLMGLAQDGLLPPGFAVVGFARRPWDDAHFRNELAKGVRRYARGQGDGAFTEHAPAFRYLQSEFDDDDGYARLATLLEDIDRDRGTRGNRIFYLATPPSAYDGILRQLERHGLSHESGDRFARVIVEKPFGHDLPTACALNEHVAEAFHEHQVFRIDHYLGKETVQNILAFRFANRIFEPLWSNNYIDHVQITVAESIGIEDRGRYFEESGIVRDMIQNHLLQILTLVAMEPPTSLDAKAIRDEKVKVLRAIRSIAPGKVARDTLRGQYTRSFVNGIEVPGYREEDGVDPESGTETYAAVRLKVDNWRWAGTPFFLRAGKRMARRVTEVAIHFRFPPHLLFHDAQSHKRSENILLLRIQPDEGISLRIGSKVPGPDFRIRNVRMDFDYGSAFGSSSADAYERLLLDAMLGDAALFARRDEVEEAWRITDSIVAGWEATDVPPAEYEAGTWGPAEQDDMLGKHREWRRP